MRGRRLSRLDQGARKWSWQQASNLQPADYKSAALPIELCQQYGGEGGIRTPAPFRAFPLSGRFPYIRLGTSPLDAATPVIPHPPSSRARGCLPCKGRLARSRTAPVVSAHSIACFACQTSDKVLPGFDGSGVRETVFRHHASRATSPRHCLAAESVASSRYLRLPPCRARPGWTRTLTIFRPYCLFRTILLSIIPAALLHQIKEALHCFVPSDK